MNLRIEHPDTDLVLYLEPAACAGLKRIAKKLADDFELVFGSRPQIVSEMPDEKTKLVIACCMAGDGLLGRLSAAEGPDFSVLDGKHEMFIRAFYKNPLPDSSDMLLIAGCDLLGTIYGMFSISELIGVSPLVFWGDAVPAHRSVLNLDTETLGLTAKEPSVRYRGFFINDEYPCFGPWIERNYGGYTAEAYDKIFELLLRLKGNYLWPAMWVSAFPLDGPGLAAMELADMYGIYMGTSHHEPCMRASEEWDKVKGEQGPYGTAWDFSVNREGLLNYWEDSLKEREHFRSVITVGMRGERDSAILGEAGMQANIDLLKTVINEQRALIKKYAGDGPLPPQMLALYKEVESFYYGDSTAQGLIDWDGLDDLILLLSDDNFGHMRTLPTPKMREHKGGFGMYYHLDYHGSPVSYEWLDSTPFSQTWEQMTEAWEYGVREMWIVNVGDLKFHEIPLCYFMDLAYDFDRYGSSRRNSWEEYTLNFARKTFAQSPADIHRRISAVLNGYIELNALRRPESLNANVYHPCHYLETDRMLKAASSLEKECDSVMTALPEKEKTAFYSMIGWPCKASVNLLRMQLYAGKNALYAKRGWPICGRFADMTEACMDRDAALKREFALFEGGRWDGMQNARHIGFTSWNDYDCRNPLTIRLRPFDSPRLSVARRDEEEVSVRDYFHTREIVIDDFCTAGPSSVSVEAANTGCGTVVYAVTCLDGELPAWLTISPASGQIEEADVVRIRFSCEASRLPEEKQTVRLCLSDGETMIPVIVSGKKHQAAAGVHVPVRNCISIPADETCAKTDLSDAFFCKLENYGKTGTAMKVFPTTAGFDLSETSRPTLSYNFAVEERGRHTMEVHCAPSNPVVPGEPLRVLLSVDGGSDSVLTFVPGGNSLGDPSDARWCRAVLDQEIVASCVQEIEDGEHTLTLGAVDPGLVIERILIYPTDNPPKASYLGPLKV